MLPSNTCEFNQCSFSTNNIKGVFVNSKLYINNESYNLPFGCTTEENSDNYIDGILGLDNSNKSFVSLLYNKKIILNDLFSVCLNKNKNGILKIGDINNKINKNNEINYINYDSVDNLYRIQIKNFIINNKNIINKNYSAIIDSTSSFTILPSDLYKKLTEEFLNNCNNNEINCGKLQKIKDIGYCSIYPNNTSMNNAIENFWSIISIKFGDFIYKWKPKNYFFNYTFSYTISKACFGFLEHNKSFIVLGSNFFNGYDIIFDRSNKKIGFVESECELFDNENEDGKIFNLKYEGAFLDNMTINDFNKVVLKESLNKRQLFFSLTFLIILVYMCYNYYKNSQKNFSKNFYAEKRYSNTLEFT